MIWNSAVLPQNWNVDRLLGKHPSIPYNPLLANAFFRTAISNPRAAASRRSFASARDTVCRRHASTLTQTVRC
jgi:ATP-dependent DNA helicase RecG